MHVYIVLYSQNYFSIGIGKGGSSKASNFSLEIGEIAEFIEIPTSIFAISLSAIINSDEIPSDILDYSCPHNDYKKLGIKQQGNERAMLGKYGVEVFKDKRFFFNVLGGVSYTTHIDLVRSNVTKWYYTQSSFIKKNGIFGVGVSFLHQNSYFSLQLDYDNRRGFTGGVGFIF